MISSVKYLCVCLLAVFAFGYASCGQDGLKYKDVWPIVKKVQLLVNRQDTGDIVFLFQKHEETTNIVLNYVSDGDVYIQDNNSQADAFADLYPRLIYNDANDLYAVPNYSGKGAVAEILAKYFMHKAVNMTIGIKIIIVINSEDVRSSQDIDSLLSYFSEILPNWKNLKSSLILLGVAEEVCKSRTCEKDMIPDPSIELCAKANIETFQNPWIVKHKNTRSDRIYVAKSPIQDYLKTIPTYHHINTSFFSSLSDTSKGFHQNLCLEQNKYLTSVLQDIEKHVEDGNNKILLKSTNIFVDSERIVKTLKDFLLCLNSEDVSLSNLIQCIAIYQIHVEGLARYFDPLSEILPLLDFCEAFAVDSRQFSTVLIQNSIKNLHNKLDLQLKQQIIWDIIYKRVYKYFTTNDIAFGAKSYRNESNYDLDALAKDVNVYDMFDALRPHDMTKLEILRTFIVQFESTSINMELSEDCMELRIMENFVTMSRIDESKLPYCGITKHKKVVIFAYKKLIIDTIPLRFQNLSLTLISPEVEIHDFDLKEYVEVNHAGSVFLLLGAVVDPNLDISHMVVYKRDNGTIQYNSKEIFDLSISQYKLNFIRTVSLRYVNDFQFLEDLDSLLYGQGEACLTQAFVNEMIELETYSFEKKRNMIPIRKQFLKNIEIYYQNPCSQESSPENKSILKDLYGLAWSELNTMLNTYAGVIATNLSLYTVSKSRYLTQEYYNLPDLVHAGEEYYDSLTTSKDGVQDEKKNLDEFTQTVQKVIELKENEIGVLLDLIQNLKTLSDTPMETITKYRKHLANKLNEKILLDTLVTMQQHFNALYSFLDLVNTLTKEFVSQNEDDLYLYTDSHQFVSLTRCLDSLKHEIDRGLIIDNIISTLKNSSSHISSYNLHKLTKSDIQEVRQSRKKFFEVYYRIIQSLETNENFTNVRNTDISNDKWCDVVIAFASSNFENYKNDKNKIKAHCEIIKELSGDIHLREKLELFLAPLIEKISDYVNLLSDGKSTHSEFVSTLDSLNISDQLKYLNAQILRPLLKLSHVSKGLSQAYQDLIFASTRLEFIAETSFQLSQNYLFKKYITRKWKSASDVTLFDSAISKHLEPMLLSNLAYALYMKMWNTAKEHVFPYVEFLPDRNIRYSARRNKHNISSAVSEKLESLESNLRFNSGLSRHTLLRVWKYEEYSDQIDRLLKEQTVVFDTDIIRDSVDISEAIKVNDLYIVLRAHRKEIQASMDDALLTFGVQVTHSGMSIFKYCGEYYAVNTEPAHIYRSYNRGEHAIYNEVYGKFHEGNPIFSPYTKWKIFIAHYEQHRKLPRHHGKVDLELYGTIVPLRDYNPRCRFTNVSKYYTHYNPFYDIIKY